MVCAIVKGLRTIEGTKVTWWSWRVLEKLHKRMLWRVNCVVSSYIKSGFFALRAFQNPFELYIV